MESSQIQLPNELLQLIINNIDPTSRTGQSVLRACSRANQALCVVSQRRLFEEVTLSYKLTRSERGIILFDDEKTTGHKFLSLLNTSPHISPYTKRLTIEELPLEAAQSRKTSWSPSDVESFSLYEVTAQCQGLQSFVSRCYIDWSTLEAIEERTGTFFLDLVRRVQELDYRTFRSFPIFAFFGSYNVQQLHISSLGHCEINDQSHSETSQVQLQSLDLSDNSNLIQEKEVILWFDSPDSPLNITQLQSLIISVTRGQVPAMDKILILCSNTLENLDLRLDLYLNTILTSTMKPLNLDTLLSLRNLDIRITIVHFMYRQAALNRDTNTYMNDFSYTASMLQILPLKQHPYPPLQLNLNLHVSDFRTFEKQFPYIPWLDLVRVLDEDEMSSRITRVNLLIKPFEDGSPLGTSLSTLTSVLDRNDGLRRLREKGILSYGCY